MQVICIKHPRFSRVLIAILLAHLLAIMAMTACPALHEWAHHDANDNDHDCAVVLFVGGAAAAVGAVVFIIAAWVRSDAEAVPRLERVEGTFRVLRILEHAPPAAA